MIALHNDTDCIVEVTTESDNVVLQPNDRYNIHGFRMKIKSVSVGDKKW